MIKTYNQEIYSRHIFRAYNHEVYSRHITRKYNQDILQSHDDPVKDHSVRGI